MKNRTLDEYSRGTAIKPKARQGLRFIVAAFYFLFPLESLRIGISSYPVSPAFVLVCALSASLFLLVIPRLRMSVRSTSWFFALVVWCAFTLIWNNAEAELISLFVFIILAFPLLFKAPSRAIGVSALRWFLRGGIFSLVFVFYHLGVELFSLPPLAQVLPMFASPSTYQVGGFNRVSGPFMEPAHYAIYLSFLIMAVDLLPRDALSTSKCWLLRSLFVLAMLGTLSLSGFSLIAMYFIFRVVAGIRKSAFRSLQLRRFASWMLALCLFYVIVLSIPGFLLYFQHRADSVRKAFSEGTLSGSEGTRLNVVQIPFDYAKEADTWKILMGEGFNNYEEWLQDSYRYSEDSAMSRGAVQNIFVSIFLGTGVIGLFFYIMFVRTLLPARGLRKVPLFGFFVVWIFAHFSTGHLILYPLMGYAYLLKWVDVSGQQS